MGQDLFSFLMIDCGMKKEINVRVVIARSHNRHCIIVQSTYNGVLTRQYLVFWQNPSAAVVLLIQKESLFRLFCMVIEMGG